MGESYLRREHEEVERDEGASSDDEHRIGSTKHVLGEYQACRGSTTLLATSFTGNVDATR